MSAVGYLLAGCTMEDIDQTIRSSLKPETTPVSRQIGPNKYHVTIQGKAQEDKDEIIFKFKDEAKNLCKEKTPIYDYAVSSYQQMGYDDGYDPLTYFPNTLHSPEKGESYADFTKRMERLKEDRNREEERYHYIKLTFYRVAGTVNCK